MSSRTRHRRCEGSPLSYSKRWRLFSRLAGDASLRSAWHTLGVRFFGPSPLRMTSTCHSEWTWGIPGYYWWEILRGFTPQNDSVLRGQQPFVIPSAREESRAICLRFFTTLTLHSEWHHTVKVASLGYVIPNRDLWSSVRNLYITPNPTQAVWGISSFLLTTVAIVLSLGWRCFAIAQHDRHLAGDSSSLRSSEWQALARDSSRQSLSRRQGNKKVIPLITHRSNQVPRPNSSDRDLACL